MKQWLETRQLLDRLAALQSRGRRAALATVVRVRGSAYRRPGAKLLVADDGSTDGNVSGGCLEQDVREAALGVIATGRAELRRYCSGADPVDAWDLGVGCEGEVEVFVEPIHGDRRHLRRQLDGDTPFAFCTPIEEGGDGAAAGLLLTGTDATGTVGSVLLDSALVKLARQSMVEQTAESRPNGGTDLLASGGISGLHRVAGRVIFVDHFRPPPHLLVFGAGDDALPLVRLALQTGFRVTVVDRRPGLLAPGRFPSETRLVEASAALLEDRLPLGGESLALLMTHSFADDRAYAEALAGIPLRYLGILGPQARTDRMLRDTSASALVDDRRLYGPVGLDIGTEGAEQVAVSIVAELLAVLSGRAGGHLRDRCAPIHAEGD